MTNRTDNFNRADTTNNIGTPSDGGSAWVQDSGTWGIQTNTGYISASPGNNACVLESSVSNVDVQATLTTSGNKSLGIIVREVDDNNYVVLVSFNGLTLYKKVSGTYTSIASASYTFANNDVMKVEADTNNLITGYINGTSKLSATFSGGSTNTRHGLFAGGNIGINFDDFSITALGGATQELSLLMMGVGA